MMISGIPSQFKGDSRTASQKRARYNPEGLEGAPVILVVDDEAEIRKLVRLLTERAGYRVREASNADDALRILQEGAPPPNLLLTDIVMPGMSGLGLAARAHHLQPSLPVIFMTGFANEYQAELSGSVCLRKPFKAAELLTAIQDVIGPPGKSPEQ
jgi:CheY-like chemotaxis protein